MLEFQHGSSRTGSLIEGLAGSRDDYIPDGEFMFPVVMENQIQELQKQSLTLVTVSLEQQQ